MPRAPALYDRKLRWRRYDGMDSDELPLSKDNYSAAVDHVEEVEEMFREDLKEGHMRWLTDKEALEEFGEYTTAAIGALEKGDNSFRVIHDATHG
eukprot:5475295-Karenia_brevis.AAC.1